MSKCILLMDTPESCWGCDLENGHHCAWGMRYIENEEFETVPDWCPLKYVPEKKNVRNFCLGEKDFEQKGYQRGYNACIDEVLKGANENE